MKTHRLLSGGLAASLCLLWAGCARTPQGPAPGKGRVFTATGVAFLEERPSGASVPVLSWDSVVEATGVGFPAPGAVSPHQKRLTAFEAARAGAMAKLVEKLEGAHVTKQASVRDMRFASEEIRIELDGRLVGIRSVRGEYDEKAEMAAVTLQVGLDEEGNIVPDRLLPITPLSVAARRAQAEQAARYDALAKLREQVGGARIRQDITVKNLVLTRQKARLVVEGMLEGVEFAEPKWPTRTRCVVSATLAVTPAEFERLRAMVAPVR